MKHIETFFEALVKTAISKEVLRELGSGKKYSKEEKKALKDAATARDRKRFPKTSKYGVPAFLTAMGAGYGGSVGYAASNGKRSGAIKGGLIGGAVGSGVSGLREWQVRRRIKRHEARTK